MANTYVDEMNELLGSLRSDGVSGVRLFVPDSRDITVEDVAHDFCMMEHARQTSACTERTTLGF